MKIKTIAVILVFLMICPTISCGSAGIQEQSTIIDTSETSPEAANEYSRLPERDFKGYAYNFLVYSDDTSPLTFFTMDTQTGDIYNDAVYTRNAMIEERYNVKLNFTAFPTQSNMAAVMKPVVMAGDNDYDLYITHTSEGPIGMLTDNLVKNWNDIPYVQLDMPWWDSRTTELIDINGYLPFAVSDFCTPIYAFSTALIFNKNLAGAFKITDPYETVRSGKWTMERFLKDVAEVTGDVNGDDKWDENDNYGFASNKSYHWQAFPASCDIKFIEKNEKTGEPVLVTNIDRFTTLIEELNTLYNAGHLTYAIPHDEVCPISFDNDNILYTIVWLAQLAFYRDSNSDYGIIPLPKLDEAQNDYYTLVNRRGCVYAVPINAEDIERTGLIIEALSILSHEDVVPRYLETTLNSKYSRDEESIEMLNIIASGKRYDFGYFYPSECTANATGSLLKNGDTNVSSYMASNQAVSEKYYQDIYGMYTNNFKEQ